MPADAVAAFVGFELTIVKLTLINYGCLGLGFTGIRNLIAAGFILIGCLSS